ncbi:hypothetical protein FEM03_01145 [Phragmitibacter flavus]|uniref:Glycine zipper domain-containing protein n=1 Tax=Phragmitibacter flavus TaxID=2576071 RepID=A0A5R8KKF6_9BACT|nr:hypothetical protein [Phragmitibacter flavus]TLD72711.1 hypothetical protein FEM03_01145 [Phragmitibacter flavus]
MTSQRQHRQLSHDPAPAGTAIDPVGTSIGALSGGITGAALGAVGGPIAAMIGAVAGLVAGGLLGKNVAEPAHLQSHGIPSSSTPASEASYWAYHCHDEPYFDDRFTYADYAPAYRLGYETKELQSVSRFENQEANLRYLWESSKGKSPLSWEQAQPAIKAAWDRNATRES